MALPRVDARDLDALLAAVQPADWHALQRKHLFVTGGTGFLGCWLLEALLHADTALSLGLHLTVLSRRPQAFQAKAPHLAAHRAVTLLAGDVRDTAAIQVRCDAVIHAATDVETPDPDPVAAFEAIVAGSRSIFNIAARAGASRVLHVSSGAVYGEQPPAVSHLPEDHPAPLDGGQPGAAYALGKRVSEWLGDQAAIRHGFDIVHARVFALIGPYLPLNAHFAAGNFLADAAAARPVRVGGNGAPFRSYLYAADAAAWLLTMLVRGVSGQSYNVGSEQAISIVELARQLAALAGVEVQVADSRPTTSAAPRYVPATRLARETLGLVQYTALPLALERSLHWARQMPAAQAAA
jgi:nucleoside-diphosphate-sugar epimerase